MANVPYMQFQPYNPVGTAIDSYASISDALRLQQEMQMKKQMMPYQMQGAHNELALQQGKIDMLPYDMEMAALKNELYRDKELTDMYYKQSQIQRNNQLSKQGGPLGHGVAGMIQMRDRFLEEGKESDAALVQREIDATVKNKEAFNFRSAPPDVKRSMIAQGVGLGLDQSSALNALSSGMTIDEIAESQGIPPEEIDSYTPSYNATQPNITAAKNREVASTELEYLQPLVNEGMGEYISKMPINGYSPQQAFDLAQGLNPDKQIKFMAAQMIMPELILLRLRQVGSEVSHAQYQELADKAIGVRNTFEKGMTPEIYMEANNLANKWLGGAAQVANKKMYTPARGKKQKQELTNAVAQDLSGNGKKFMSIDEEIADIDRQLSELGGQ